MANKLSHRVYNIGNDAPLNYWEFTEVVKKIVPGMQIELQRDTAHSTGPAPTWTTPVSEKKWDIAAKHPLFTRPMVVLWIA